MENKSIVLILAIIFILVIGIIFGVGKKQELMKIDTQKQETENQKNVNYVENEIYKKVSFSDGEIAISFDVPEDWFIETRNSGEKEMTTEEMREYLATNWRENIKNNPKITSNYTDWTWNMLKNLTREKMKKMFKDRNQIFPYKESFPNASVALGSGMISYVDSNADQVDFNIVNPQNEKVQKAIAEYKEYYLNDDIHENSGLLKKEIDGFEVDMLYSKAKRRDKDGEPIPGLDSSGASRYFIEIKNSNINKMLIIWKQAEWREEDENSFNKLIETLKIDVK